MVPGTRLTTFSHQSRPRTQTQEIAAEIATAAGFGTANVMSMLNAGSIRLPLDRLPALVLALEADPVHLFLLVLEQLAGDITAVAFQKIFCKVVKPAGQMGPQAHLPNTARIAVRPRLVSGATPTVEVAGNLALLRTIRNFVGGKVVAEVRHRQSPRLAIPVKIEV